MAIEINQAKQLVIDAGLKLLEQGLIVRTWGNISARISDTQFVITPSGKGYTDLTPDDIVVVNIKKLDYEGDIKPSSECGIHADVYAMRPEVDFVVHTHQTYASTISILGQDIELSEEEQKFLGDNIPCAAYGMSASPDLRKQVKKCLKTNKNNKAMLLRNHGVLCMGADFDDCFDISSMLEQVCKYKYDVLTSGYDKIQQMGDEEPVESWDDILEVEEDEGAYIDYGNSTCEIDEVVFTWKEKEYTFKVGADKNPLGKNLFKRTANKIAKLHSDIYADRNIRYISHVTLPNIVSASEKMKVVRPYIDDQAMIIGEQVKVIGKIGKKAKYESSKAILKELKDNNAVMIAGQGALVTGKTKEDVEAAAFILEKGCMAARLAACQADAEPVPKKYAKKERSFYVESYSKLK